MVDSPQDYIVPNFPPKPSMEPKLLRYLGPSLLATIAMACIAGLYLQLAPKRYSSAVTLNLPSVSSAVRVDVPGLGATSVQSSSPYASAQDPRENYKIIAGSDQVLEQTAKLMQQPIAAMGRPKIKVVDGSTVMQVEFMGKTAAEARDKTNAFYQAMEMRLDELRQQSATENEKAVQRTIDNTQQKLNLAQQQVAQYRARTGLNSEVQVQEMARNIEELRRQRAELQAEQTRFATRRNVLQNNLAVTPQQATASLKLQADPLIQETVKKYSETTAELANTESIYQPDHPAVLQERDKQLELQQLLRQRAIELIGSDDLGSINISTPAGSSARETLIQDLVLAQVDTNGLSAKIDRLDRAIEELENELGGLAQAQVGLDGLKRNMQIAETVFSSKLAQLDVDSSNVYDAYPKMQLLAAGNLPDAPVSPKQPLVLGGVGAASILLNTGALTLWAYRRKNWRQQNGFDDDRGLNPQPGLA
jgi:uncharacterized protein involved in exopolysaccharide biosynthesis